MEKHRGKSRPLNSGMPALAELHSDLLLFFHYLYVPFPKLVRKILSFPECRENGCLRLIWGADMDIPMDLLITGQTHK